eukprot:Lithocolla_globosa_v1_NODE_691_length_3431_cov_13.706457.p4 type:complete len:103 gc:universal NODE_691_length_3431_cov_13.706457:2126-2434(+)
MRMTSTARLSRSPRCWPSWTRPRSPPRARPHRSCPNPTTKRSPQGSAKERCRKPAVVCGWGQGRMAWKSRTNVLSKCSMMCEMMRAVQTGCCGDTSTTTPTS